LKGEKTVVTRNPREGKKKEKHWDIEKLK